MSSILQKFLITPGNHADWIAAIEGAKESIEMEMFHLTDMKVVAALTDAAARRVKVLVIIDGKSLNRPHNQQAFAALRSGGVTVLLSSPAFAITHSKLMRVDGRIVFLTTMNLTNEAAHTRDYGWVVDDALISADIGQLIQVDQQNSINGTGKNPSFKSPLLILSPVNALSSLVQLYKSAKCTIDTTSENFGDKEIQQALIGAAKSGVRVRVIGPEYLTADDYEVQIRNYPYLKALKEGGVLVKVMPNPSTAEQPYMHGKSDLIDGEIVSDHSQNLSFSSLTRSREVGIIVKDSWAVAQQAPYFEKDWANAVDLPDQPPPPLPKQAA